VRRGGDQDVPRPEVVAEGAPPPWAELSPDARSVALHEVAARVAARGPGRPWLRPGGQVLVPGARASAVLVALYEERDEPVVILTKRAATLRVQPGHISFPGGREDPGETAVQTALREAHEETGLDPSLPRVVGELDHLATIGTGALIVPVVAQLPSGRPRLVPAAAEVEAVLHVPLSELMDDGVYREELWGERPLQRPVWFFDLEGETVWGATAAMLRNLLLVAAGLDGV